MLIFVVCLLLGTALIGLGMAYVIKLKQRVLPSRQTNAVTGQSGIRPVACAPHLCRYNLGIVGEFQLVRQAELSSMAAAPGQTPQKVTASSGLLT